MKFKDWFMHEKATLRELGDDFVEDEPRLAPFLGANSSAADVEHLMEGFAFLTARQAMKVEDHLPEITHPLLQRVYPNVLRPLPSLTLMQFQPIEHALSETQVLARGTSVFSRPVEGVSCEFRTCSELALAPLRISAITAQRGTDTPVLRIDLEALSEQPLRRMRCEHLCFHLADDTRHALSLYLWLARHLDKLYLHVNQQRLALPPTVAFVGFEPKESLLPSPGEQLDGYRILQEYFLFPERFLGFRIDGLAGHWPDEPAQHLQLELRFDAPFPADLRIDRTSILLNCVPAINLFSTPGDPIVLNGEEICEPLRVSRRNGPDPEIFSVDRVSSRQQNARTPRRHFKPYESLEPRFPLAEQDPPRYFKVDIEQDPISDQVRHQIRLVHHDLSPYLGQLEALSIDLTCSNGALARQLDVGQIDAMTQDTPSFVTYRNLTRPTRSYPPLLQSAGHGEHHWALISNLALNNLSLSSPAALASVLRAYDLVAPHDLQQQRRTAKRLEAIRQIANEPCDWLIKGRPVRGMRTTLHIDPAGFDCEGELQLFGNVLSHFMALYASGNAFHQLQIINASNNNRQLWPARTGRQPVM